MFVALFVLCVVAKFSIKPRIIGGKDAIMGQFRYQVSIRKKAGHSHFCGGSILNQRFILTAVHCTTVFPAKDIYVAVGALISTFSGLNYDGVAIDIDKLIVHEDFYYEINKNHRVIVKTLRNDIALIRTASEIIFTNFVQPIDLPTQDLPKGGNTRLVVSGWGNTNKTETGFMQYFEVHTVTNEECFEFPPIRKHCNKNNICTFNRNGWGVSHADSGKKL